MALHTSFRNGDLVKTILQLSGWWKRLRAHENGSISGGDSGSLMRTTAEIGMSDILREMPGVDRTHGKGKKRSQDTFDGKPMWKTGMWGRGRFLVPCWKHGVSLTFCVITSRFEAQNMQLQCISQRCIVNCSREVVIPLHRLPPMHVL